jgi:hypothetical protein
MATAAAAAAALFLQQDLQQLLLDNLAAAVQWQLWQWHHQPGQLVL